MPSGQLFPLGCLYHQRLWNWTSIEAVEGSLPGPLFKTFSTWFASRSSHMIHNFEFSPSDAYFRIFRISKCTFSWKVTFSRKLFSGEEHLFSHSATSLHSSWKYIRFPWCHWSKNFDSPWVHFLSSCRACFVGRVGLDFCVEPVVVGCVLQRVSGRGRGFVRASHRLRMFAFLQSLSWH